MVNPAGAWRSSIRLAVQQSYRKMGDPIFENYGPKTEFEIR
jgi:hypothetical protein